MPDQPTKTRTETDTFGPIEVDATRYWGAQAQRSLANFKIGWEKQPKPVIRGLGIVKRAAAEANMDLGRLDLVLRTGLWRPIWRNGWAPTMGAAVIRWRQELRPFERYWLETRLSAWTESVAVMEQTFVIASGPRRGRVAAATRATANR